MNMGTAGFFKHPGNEDLMLLQDMSADRAGPLPVSLQTVGAARDVHKPVGMAHGGKGRRFYPFPAFKPGGTNRTSPGGAGESLSLGVFFPFPVPALGGTPPSGAVQDAEEQVIAKPEEQNADNDKYQCLKKRSHTLPWRIKLNRLY
jgi:hypothetical protein